MKKFEAHKLRK